MTDLTSASGADGSSDWIDLQIMELSTQFAAGSVSAARKQGEKLSSLAFERLITEHRLSEAAAAIAGLARLFPRSTYFDHMKLAFATLPPPSADKSFAQFRDDVTKDVQIVRKQGASTVLLGFCGNQHKMSLPLELMHRWMGQIDASVIYLRDLSNRGYLQGIRSLGEDYSSSVRELQSLVQGLAPRRVICQGHSTGGHAALRMGLDLGVDAILAFGAQTNPMLNLEQHGRIRRLLGIGPGDDLAEHLGVGTNIARAYASASSAPEVRLVYSGGYARDVAQAEDMRGLSRVILEPVGRFTDHGVFYHVLRSGKYARQLAQLASPHDNVARTSLRRTVEFGA